MSYLYSQLVAIILLVVCVSLLVFEATGDAKVDVNPFNQQLPDCSKGYSSITKKTKEKAIVCPMFRYESYLYHHHHHEFETNFKFLRLFL